MKHKLLFLALLLATAMLARGQCSTDTLFPPIPPSTSTQTDTLEDPMLPCYPYGCKASYCHIWQLPQNYSGIVSIWSNTLAPLQVNVQFWQDCNLVRFDSCVYVAQASILFWDTILQFPENAQIVVCNSSEPITIGIKPMPCHDTLPAPFLLTDTLCGQLVNIEPPMESQDEIIFEFDGIMWRQVAERPKNGRIKVKRI